MARYKVVFTDYYYPNNDREREVLARLEDVEILDCTQLFPGGVKDEERLLQYACDADAIIVQFAKISRKVIMGLDRCKIVSRYAIGVDNIDLPAARERGIVVANVPDYCIEEVSDSAVAHILNCVRKVTRANNLLREGKFVYADIKPIRRLGALTTGLLAFGHIARRTAEKLRPFGTTLLAYDPYFEHQASYPWVQFVSLEELLARSDILSVHAPLNPETHHLLNRERLALCKPGAIVVNTSRGGLIDEAALAEAIEAGTIAAAGLDVLEFLDEEYRKSVLLNYPDRVFITPHMGWYSEEAMVDLQRKTALNVYEMLTNGRPIYQV